MMFQMSINRAMEIPKLSIELVLFGGLQLLLLCWLQLFYVGGLQLIIVVGLDFFVGGRNNF